MMETKSEIKRGSPGIYNSWRGMRDRCNRKNRADAHCYSAKGITICQEWDDVREFKLWALANGYEPGLTIERKDGSLDYCPENCKWATRLEQARNISRNRILTFQGCSLCIGEWAQRTGIAYANIIAHIDRLGWDIEKALTTPSGSIPSGPKRSRA